VGFTYQQITGQAFVSTYQTVFYKSNGFAAQAFTYPVINGVLGTLAVIPGMFLVDSLGWVVCMRLQRRRLHKRSLG
jgi:hypothetical protein